MPRNVAIQLRRSSTPGQGPPSDLLEGEPAVNLADGRLWVGLGNGQAVELGGGGGGSGSSLLFALPGLPRPGPLPGDNNPVVPFIIGSAASTTLANGTNNARFIPWAVYVPIRITSVSIAVTQSSAGTAQVGVYASSSSQPFAPTSRLYVVTGIDTGSTGVKTVSGLEWNLQPGIYWFAVWTSANPTLRAIPIGNLFALSVVISGTAVVNHYYFTSTGGLPNPAPTSGFISTNAAYPAIGVLYTLL